MNEKHTENKGCAGLLRNPAHPLFSDFFHRQCVKGGNFFAMKIGWSPFIQCLPQ